MLSTSILCGRICDKGLVAKLALCLADENEKVRLPAKLFFTHLSEDEDDLYDVIPEILSYLSDSEVNLSEQDFQEIIK